tara:strand:+ start:102 stop:335 length:234 start_codon:yes stop_codon:yes gene_type:complete
MNAGRAIATRPALLSANELAEAAQNASVCFVSKRGPFEVEGTDAKGVEPVAIIQERQQVPADVVGINSAIKFPQREL